MMPSFAERLDVTARASLAARIGAALTSAGIPYVAWKGDPRIDRFEAAAGDLDLLIDRAYASALPAALAPFGFRPAMSGPVSAIAGVTSYFAPHPEHGGLLHLHAHFRLLIGRAGHARYHLPIEREVLGSSVIRGGLHVPAPAVAFLLFVLHATLRHDWRHTAHQRAWLDGAERTLAMLREATNERDVRTARARLLPQISDALLLECERAIATDRPGSMRFEAALQLQHALRGHRAPWMAASFRRATRRGLTMIGVRTATGSAAHPAGGGSVIALAGADGAGKSTCAKALVGWLAPAFEVAHLHLGRPRRSALTYVAGLGLKVAATAARLIPGRAMRSLLAHTELARTVCTARDRAKERERAGRLAARGTIVICERLPASELDPLSGTSEAQGVARAAHSGLADWLRDRERSFYRRMSPADVTLVLRLPPDLAVRRKPEEPSTYVRRRAELVWNATWDAPRFRVIDASRPVTEVMRDLRANVWRSI